MCLRLVSIILSYIKIIDKFLSTWLVFGPFYYRLIEMMLVVVVGGYLLFIFNF